MDQQHENNRNTPTINILSRNSHRTNTIKSRKKSQMQHTREKLCLRLAAKHVDLAVAHKHDVVFALRRLRVGSDQRRVIPRRGGVNFDLGKDRVFIAATWIQDKDAKLDVNYGELGKQWIGKRSLQKTRNDRNEGI
jgi:hypothetical protein